VVAEDDEQAGVEGARGAVEPVEHVDHLLAVEDPAQERRKEQVAGVEDQQVGSRPFELGAQGAEAGEAAARSGVDALDAVDVVDGEQRRGSRSRGWWDGSRRLTGAAGATTEQRGQENGPSARRTDHDVSFPVSAGL
jgi:hypothetical protein